MKVPDCGANVKVIACIEDPVVIKKSLAHLKAKTSTAEFSPLPATPKLVRLNPFLR